MEGGGRENRKLESPIPVLATASKTPFISKPLKNTQTSFETTIGTVQNTNNMTRIIKKCRDFFLYLTSQFPGFMLIFYLCYLYTGWLVFIFFTSLSLAVFLYQAQDSLLYQPNTPPDSRHYVISPDQFNLPYEDFFIKTSDDVSLHAYFLKQPNISSSYTVLVLHGNAGNIGHRLYNSQMLYQECTVNVMLVEYRGYGRSEGIPSEAGLITDATTAIEYLLNRNDINPRKILVFGRSLGGAVAIPSVTRLLNDTSRVLHPTISNKNLVAAVILENTFTSIVDMGVEILKTSLISYVPSIFVKNKFTSIDTIQYLKAPCLFLSAQQDEIVPPRMMKALYEKSGSMLKRFVKFTNGSHNECWRLPGYYKHILDFITEIERQHPGGNTMSE